GLEVRAGDRLLLLAGRLLFAGGGCGLLLGRGRRLLLGGRRLLGSGRLLDVAPLLRLGRHLLRLLLLLLRLLALFVDHQASISIGAGFCAVCGWSGPAYTFSLRSWARASRLRGIIPLTARRMTSSGRRSSISPRVRERRPPG